MLTNRKIQDAREMDPKTPLNASWTVKWRSDSDDMVAVLPGCDFVEVTMAASRGRCRSYG
jgi:hypothetical protein